MSKASLALASALFLVTAPAALAAGMACCEKGCECCEKKGEKPADGGHDHGGHEGHDAPKK